jgi:hypothetical protein
VCKCWMFRLLVWARVNVGKRARALDKATGVPDNNNNNDNNNHNNQQQQAPSMREGQGQQKADQPES